MRSVVFETFGVPEQVLGLAERPRPVPGAGQVLVRLVLSPIHNHDLMTIAGEYGIKPALPAVPATHFLRVVRKVMLKGGAVADVTGELWALLAILLVISAIAMLRYRQTLD
jgi:NADPH:quinone reductase-like Zn-dependent oxidoreductase